MESTVNCHLMKSSVAWGMVSATYASSQNEFTWLIQSRFAETRFAETRFAETPTLTLTLNPNFGESGFGESGRHQNGIAMQVGSPGVRQLLVVERQFQAVERQTQVAERRFGLFLLNLITASW